MYVEGAAEEHRLAGIHPLTYVQESLSHRRSGGPPTAATSRIRSQSQWNKRPNPGQIELTT